MFATILVAVLAISTLAQADTIFYTGVPSTNGIFGTYALNHNQWLAGKFTIGNAYDVYG